VKDLQKLIQSYKTGVERNPEEEEHANFLEMESSWILEVLCWSRNVLTWFWGLVWLDKMLGMDSCFCRSTVLLMPDASGNAPISQILVLSRINPGLGPMLGGPGSKTRVPPKLK